jgi:hypothetical protein
MGLFFDPNTVSSVIMSANPGDVTQRPIAPKTCPSITLAAVVWTVDRAVLWPSYCSVQLTNQATGVFAGNHSATVLVQPVAGSTASGTLVVSSDFSGRVVLTNGAIALASDFANWLGLTVVKRTGLSGSWRAPGSRLRRYYRSVHQ